MVWAALSVYAAQISLRMGGNARKQTSDPKDRTGINHFPVFWLKRFRASQNRRAMVQAGLVRLSRRRPDAPEITGPAARELAFLARALEASVAFLARAFAGGLGLERVSVTLDAKLSGDDAVAVLMKAIIAAGGLRGRRIGG